MEDKLIRVLDECLNDNLIDIIISNGPKDYEISKIKIRPIILKNNLVFQGSLYKGKQVFHQNYEKNELLELCNEWLVNCMKQVFIRTKEKEISILISKKGNVTIKQKTGNKELLDKKVTLTHNREKSYIISEGSPVPFLVDLGVMTTTGQIVKAKYDKFKQINRFLEFIQDILPALNKGEENTIVDFGCGKSYLTFAMYYYLKEIKGYNIKIIGLDLKKEVILNCSKLASKYGYDKLVFLEGDIASYNGVTKVDMVVTLHACDTATDYALLKAYEWGAKVILSVPCCQLELNKQIKNDILSPILNYGLLKERMAALITDGIRANLLESVGYKTQVLEFIDMEHTPKNILIRAVKRDNYTETTNENTKIDKSRPNILEEFEQLREFLNINPTLSRLLNESHKKE